MKILLSSDWHLASKGPSTRKDDWHATVNRKLDFVERIADEQGVDTIGIAGDLFDKDSLAYSSGVYAPMGEATGRFQRWSKRWPLLVVPGNHDLVHNRLDLLDKTAFGVLVAAQILTPVWNTIYKFKDAWVAGIPYPVTDEALRALGEKTAKLTTPGVVLLHCYGSLTGGTHYGGHKVFDYPGIGQKVPNAVAFCLGHDHRDLGVEVLGRQTFIQLGSLLRGTRADDQVTRQPKIAVVETLEARPLMEAPASCTVTLFDVPIEPPQDVFTEKKAQVEDANTAIDQYVDELAKIERVDSPALRLDRLTDVPELVKNRALAYLQQAAQG